MTNSQNTPQFADTLHTDAENWQQLQELFHYLTDTPAEDRAALIDAMTLSPALRERLDSLLAATFDKKEKQAIAPAQQIGDYPLLRFLGSGGLGEVYLTERLVGGAVQTCAIKLLSIPLAQGNFQARFEREQQILATLNHPNITQLLDAGVSERRQPYLVMEFIDGLDLTRHTNQLHLPVRERIRLLLDVCDAVAYAHRSLVVHLDLKPSNVMVRHDGMVKLLDFGTSRFIGGVSTATTTIMATPAYSSPEQLRGEPVTTACDIYSVGVMLYELLTGQRPFQTSTVGEEVGRATREQEPQPLMKAITAAAAADRGVTAERLRQLLAGDLSAIVARCLRSRPQDRYPTVEALAGDLRRYLAGQTVLTRRQTSFYRMAKFSRRHRVALATCSVALALGVVSTVFSLERQQRALREGRRAQQMQVFLGEVLKTANKRSIGKPAATLPEFLRLGVKLLPDYIKEPKDLRSAQLSLAQSMFDGSDMEAALPLFQQVAASAHEAHDVDMEVQADSEAGVAALELGNAPLADELTAKALELSHMANVSVKAQVYAKGNFAFLRLQRGFEPEKNLALVHNAVDQAQKAGLEDPDQFWILKQASIMESLRGDLANAELHAQQALAIADREPPSATADRAEILASLGLVHLMSGDAAGSLPLLQRGYGYMVACCGTDDMDTLGVKVLIAKALLQTGHPHDAIATLEPILPALKTGYQNGPRFATPLSLMARAYTATGEPAKAEECARQVLTIIKGKIDPRSSGQASSYLILAQALSAQGKLAEALANAELSRQIYDSAPSLSVAEKPRKAEADVLTEELRRKLARSK